MGITMDRRLLVGDKFVSKKVHPCGGNMWEVVGVGVDFKIKCVKCGRILIVAHDNAYKMIKNFISEN